MRASPTDAPALLALFTVTGFLDERFLAGMDGAEADRSRAIGAFLTAPTARTYGLWRDWLMGRFAGPGAPSQPVGEGVALPLFQVPPYALILRAGGAEGGGLLRGGLGAAGIMLASGRPYGLRLGLVRGWLGLGPGGTRPMSLGG